MSNGTEPNFALIELHEADVVRVVFDAKTIILDLANVSVHVPETETTYGIWLHNAQIVATGATQVGFSSPLGLGDEADSIYSATLTSAGRVVQVGALVRGVTDCECAFDWATSGTTLRFRSDFVRLELGHRSRRLGTWDLATQRMRE